MAELLADPGFDLIYSRAGSVFIFGDNGTDARALIRKLATGVDELTAVAIFPEGRLFRADRLARASARLAAENPQRGERLASLTHVLPPRPGGVLALIDTIPADVVVVTHAGLDDFGSFADLAKAVPLTDPIRVSAWRVLRDRIPSSDADRVVWLDEQWLRVDEWVASIADSVRLGLPFAAPPTSAPATD